MTLFRSRFAWAAALAALFACLLPIEAGEPAKVEAQPAQSLMVLRAGYYSANKRLPPRASALEVIEGRAKATAKIKVTYHDFPDGPKKAFQAAADVWGALLVSPVEIRVDAHWAPLGAGILGSAGPTTYQRDFPGAPRTQTWYPIALANKIAKKDLAPGQAHISANFSSAFNNWYYGTDSKTPPTQYDLMSVVLHELGHGLGFVGTMTVGPGGLGRWGGGTPYPVIYDRFTETETGVALLNTKAFPNPSLQLAGALTSNHVVFNGPAARKANLGSRPRLYAPLSWQGGSSYSHLDETTFPAGNANSLMTPQLGMGEAIHDPGPVGLGVLHDLGW